ncbi:sensor histidine kinase [Streptomyces kunmingensis]|uniref:Sensor histidine kinase n=1 Tax=Streptomyces kunmingensis TaxID=68225 RepID=A0ABU6C7C3_9ACTN|nr:sensor histidine kinase [Streptomyces kunmingensis]MEB3960623.1 sensor histidine kinase [Streptomyces kunmingensis]
MRTVSITEPFDHPALFYRDEQEYLAGTVPFVRDALDAGDPVAVAVPGPNLALIRDELGERAAEVHLLDMTRAGRNPGRIIPRVLRAFADSHPGRRARIIGEPIWAGRTEAEYPACVQHEALINLAFQGREATILCPYDTTRLDASVLADAYVTHPTVIESGTQADSSAYAPEALVARYNQPLSTPLGAVSMVYTAGTLPAVRQQATRWAADLGLGEHRLDDFELAVAELTTNSVVHAGGEGTLRIWAEDQHVICEVHDSGLLDDPLAGRRLPPREQRGGRGLLLVNVVADLVRVHSTPALGTTTHVYFHR